MYVYVELVRQTLKDLFLITLKTMYIYIYIYSRASFFCQLHPECNMTNFSENLEKLHFVLIPLLAQGHMIPMIDMARIFAGHGVYVTLVITPGNATRSARSIQRASMQKKKNIHILEIPFPCKEVGLPPGCENLDSVPCRSLLKNFYNGLDRMKQPIEEYLKNHETPPSCIISDKCMSWTCEIARKFHVPRLVFHGMGCFSLLSAHNVHLHKAHHGPKSDTEPFVIPGLPLRIEITKAQLPGAFVKLPRDVLDDEVRDKMRETELDSYGVVVNTFSELEYGCAEEYKKAINKKVWCIGPVSLCNRHDLDKFERGSESSIGEKECMEWLEGMKSQSVLYACLGSQCRLVPSQLIQLGLGLEASNQPFIWVIKKGEGERQEELEKWFEEERFEERIKGRGLVIKGWAPQVLILSHPAIKGFLTHCGWNSTIEGVCSGVPMITWPMFAEQFFNEKLVVEALKIGVPIGVELPVRWGDEEKVGILVTKSQVVIAIQKLFGDGEEGARRAERARELGFKAKKAMEDDGSANFDVSLLIQDIITQSSIFRAEKQ